VSTTETSFSFDPLANRADPYTGYRWLREHDPVHHDAESGMWILTRHADIQALLRAPATWSNDHRRSHTHQDWLKGMGAPPAADELLAKVLLFMDPPNHTRLRSLVSKAFTPKRVEALRSRVEAVLEDILSPLRERGEMDVIGDLAYPLPVTVICELLGVPVEDRDLFRQQTRELAVILEWQLGPDDFMAAGMAAVAFATYFLPLFEQRRCEPRDDLVSALVAAEDDGDRLSPEELLTTCVLLLTAGHETTMNLIGNGLLALLRHPDQWQHLCEGPALVRGAVEELLRYDSPVQLTARTATCDTEIDSRRIREGDQVVALLGAANRDPAAFVDPETLDVGRTDAGHHLSFGGGPHFCLGAALARIEAQVVFTALAALGGLELTVDEPEWRQRFTLRGLERLPVRLAV